MVTPGEGMARLQAAADSGALDEVARRLMIRVIAVHGSTARQEPDPADLDVAVLFEPTAPRDVPATLEALQRVAGREVDLGVVNHATPVFRSRALMHGEPVWESEAGAWIDAAVAAHLEDLDTAWLRRLDLERRAAG